MDPSVLKLPIAMLGVSFDSLTLAEAVARIERMIASRRPHYVATANVDFVVQAQSDPELRRILFEADLVLCDGKPLVWASRWLGNPLPERVAGADLVPELLQAAAKKGYRVFFLGASPESAERAARNVKQNYPGVEIAGYYSPPFQPLLEMNHDEIIRRIRKAEPDLLLVSFGCPKQEKWISMHYQALGVPVSIGVGATIDFLAGQVKRAPLWMQNAGLEWVFRLAQEPRRLFKRYAVDLGVFGVKMLRQLWRTGRQAEPKHQPEALCRMGTPGWHHLKIPARFDVSSARHNSQMVERALADSRNCVLDLREVEHIDSTGIGLLAHLQKRLRKQGRTLILLSPSEAATRLLGFMRLTEFFRTADTLQAAQRIEISQWQEESFPVLSGNPFLWQGEIRANNADEVFHAAERGLARSPSGEVQIDLSRVRFIDSTGAVVIRNLRRLAEEVGCRLAVTGASPTVRDVLRSCRLEELIVPDGTAYGTHRNGEMAFSE